MKSIAQFILYVTTLFVASTTCSEIIIKPAIEADLDAIHALTKKCFQKDFAPILAQTLTIKENLDCFIDKQIIKHQGYCQDFLTKQLNQEEYCIMTAHKAPIEQLGSLIGYCRFYKKNERTIQIGFVGIDGLSRKEGIAKKLIFAAMNKFDGIRECNFRTFSNYDFINELYSKHGCVNTGTVLLDPNTLEVVTDTINSNALISYNDYSFTIEK